MDYYRAVGLVLGSVRLQQKVEPLPSGTSLRLNRYLREHRWAEDLLGSLTLVSVLFLSEQYMPWGWAALISIVLNLVLFARFWTPRRKK